MASVWESKSVASTLGWQDAEAPLGARRDIGDTLKPPTAASGWWAQEISKDRTQ